MSFTIKIYVLLKHHLRLETILLFLRIHEDGWMDGWFGFCGILQHTNRDYIMP